MNSYIYSIQANKQALRARELGETVFHQMCVLLLMLPECTVEHTPPEHTNHKLTHRFMVGL